MKSSDSRTNSKYKSPYGGGTTDAVRIATVLILLHIYNGNRNHIHATCQSTTVNWMVTFKSYLPGTVDTTSIKTKPQFN